MPYIYYSYYTPLSKSIPAIHAQEHQTGRQLLINGLKHLYGLCYDFHDLDQILKKETNGKPFLPDHPEIHFNITHCDGLAACAFHSSPIGIDAELPGYFAPILINKALSKEEIHFFRQMASTLPQEQEWFFRFWTLKEAFVKQSGIGVDTNLKSFSFSFDQQTFPSGISCSKTDISCWQTQLDGGQIISLCYKDTGEPVKIINVSTDAI